MVEALAALTLMTIVIFIFRDGMVSSFKSGYEAGNKAGYQQGKDAIKLRNWQTLESARKEFFYYGFYHGQYKLRPQLEKYNLELYMVSPDIEHLERCLQEAKTKEESEKK